MSRIAVSAVAVLFAMASSPEPSRVEVRDADIVYALSLSPSGDRLMLDNQGSALSFGECSEEPQGQPASQRALVASVFVRNCGATVDFATHVLLRSGNESRTVAVFEGNVPVSLRWSTAGLRVTHAPVASARIVRREPTAFGVAIAYASSGTPAVPSQYVEFSSFNYGATGRAAGLPAEVLLRVAGWSQQASGMYRPEWGTWNGAPPYGDDPVGSRKIRDGILHFEQGSGVAGAGPARHLIYLHGRIVQEQQIPRPQNLRFGFYELEKILTTFRERGFVVTGAIRPKSASVGESADAVVRQVRQLLATGVAADHVTVLGASMGGGIALVASARLQEPSLRFAVLGVCLSQNVRGLLEDEGKAPSGHILAIRESSDESTADCPAWTADARASALVARELVLNTGLSHGFLYRPLPEWVKPVTDWAETR